MWTNKDRSEYLGSLSAFENKYCRATTPLIPGTLDRLKGSATPDMLRMLILHLTFLLPYAAHSSPGWNHRQPPVVKIGLKQVGQLAGSNSCGLVVHAEKLHFWVDNDFQGGDLMSDAQKWAPYPYGTIENRSYYKTALGGHCQLDNKLTALMSKISDAQYIDFKAYVEAQKQKKIHIDPKFDGDWVPRGGREAPVPA